MGNSCEICGGIGLVPTKAGSKPCVCQVEARIATRLKRAGIPPEFAGARLDNYVSTGGTSAALFTACRYVEEFLPGQTRTGLLLTGSVGLGKTHLAVGMVRALVRDKGVEARFYDVRELLERLRSTFDDNSPETEHQILDPLFRAELVVLDELGAVRNTDWAMETMEVIIGGLYNRQRPLIATTNYPNAPVAGIKGDIYNSHPLTLGDRIGARMFSRMQQMCAVIEMTGEDWRNNGTKIKRELPPDRGYRAAAAADEKETQPAGTGPDRGYSHQQPSALRTRDGRHPSGDLQGTLFGAGISTGDSAGSNPDAPENDRDDDG